MDTGPSLSPRPRRQVGRQRRGWRALIVIGAVWVTLAGVPGGAFSTRGPAEAQAGVGDCVAALAQVAAAAAAARHWPSPGNLRAVTSAVLYARTACAGAWKSQPPAPPDDNPPGTTPPEISPGADDTPPESGAGGHPCDGTVSVSYGNPNSSLSAHVRKARNSNPGSSDPAVATVSVDWGDGTSTTQTLAWGSTVTLTHNYYYSTSPYPRSNPGEGSDGDPDGDGSDVYIVQATVLETGAQSGYAAIEHVGPFYNNPGGGNGGPPTTTATRG